MSDVDCMACIANEASARLMRLYSNHTDRQTGVTHAVGSIETGWYRYRVCSVRWDPELVYWRLRDAVLAAG